MVETRICRLQSCGVPSAFQVFVMCFLDVLLRVPHASCLVFSFPPRACVCAFVLGVFSKYSSLGVFFGGILLLSFS